MFKKLGAANPLLLVLGGIALALILMFAGARIAPMLRGTPNQPNQAAPPTQAAVSNVPPLTMSELDVLLAPFALYPDQLLAQMLLCTADPLKISELNTWLKGNSTLKGTQLQDAAVVAGFEPSFVALVLFPQVVAVMAMQLDATIQIGKVFAADRKAVFDSIQRLRTQAQNVGSLKTTPQQEVQTQTTPSGEKVIVIEPANPQVVYVPQYNPQTVYTTQTIIVEDNSNDVAVAGLIGFTAGVVIGASMHNDYYYGPYGWHGGAYMYNDAWDDYYDHREDAREDWIDHREDLVEERGDRRENTQEERTERRENSGEQRTERTEARQENRPESQGQRAQAAGTARAEGAGAERAQSAGTQAQRTQAGGGAQAQRTQPSAATQTQRAQPSAAATQTQRTQPSAAATQTQRTQPSAAATQTRSSGSYESRGGQDRRPDPAAAQRSGTRSDAFSGYSSGQSTRAASSRGQSSRSSGGGRRR